MHVFDFLDVMKITPFQEVFFPGDVIGLLVICATHENLRLPKKSH